jgi:hypothetical protein
MCFGHPPVKEPKSCRIFQTSLFFKKKDGLSPMKSTTFVGHEFFRQRDNKPYLKIYMTEVMLLIYRMMPSIFGFDG